MNLLRQTLLTALIILVSVTVAWLMQPRFNDANVAMVYVLAVVGAALLLGRGPALAACLSSVFLLDYVNVAPYFAFSVDAFDYVFTLGVMLVTALSISSLADRLRLQAAESAERAARTAALFALSEELAEDRTPAGIREVTADHIARAFRAEVTVEEGDAGVPAATRGPRVKRLPEGVWQAWLPVRVGDGVACTFCLRGTGIGIAGDDQAAHLLAMGRLAAQALARSALREAVQASEARVQREALRSSVLGAVSHDLRTPLASIIGASSTLLESGDSLAESARLQLRQVIHGEAIHMQRMVENLLDLAHIRSGDLDEGMAWHALEEIVASAVVASRRRDGAHEYLVDVPTDLPLLRCDAVLVERLLANLLDNAAKFAPAGTSIRVAAGVAGGMLSVSVEDAGPGIRPELRERVFEPFFREGGKAGSGLGLAICRGIVAAHGGSIRIDDAGNCGTRVVFTLPLPAEVPVIEREPHGGKP